MGLIVLNATEPTLLGYLRSQWNANGVVLHLFQNNIVPTDASVLANFTDATFTGYAGQVMNFGAPAEVGGVAQIVDAAARVFTAGVIGVSNVIYGYYLVDPVTGFVLGAERFPASVNIAATGDSISILVTITLDSANH